MPVLPSRGLVRGRLISSLGASRARGRPQPSQSPCAGLGTASQAMCPRWPRAFCDSFRLSPAARSLPRSLCLGARQALAGDRGCGAALLCVCFMAGVSLPHADPPLFSLASCRASRRRTTTWCPSGSRLPRWVQPCLGAVVTPTRGQRGSGVGLGRLQWGLGYWTPRCDGWGAVGCGGTRHRSTLSTRTPAALRRGGGGGR